MYDFIVQLTTNCRELMQTIYLWIEDFLENKDEIGEQLFYENQQEKIFKVVLCYVESLIWEM